MNGILNVIQGTNANKNSLAISYFILSIASFDPGVTTILLSVTELAHYAFHLLYTYRL